MTNREKIDEVLKILDSNIEANKDDLKLCNINKRKKEKFYKIIYLYSEDRETSSIGLNLYLNLLKSTADK